jgi:zinc protease
MSARLLLEECHDLPLVSIMVGFRAGATLDPEGKEGLTRLAVRMLRRGAAGMDMPQLASAVDGIGAEFAEYVSPNAVHLQMETITRSFDRAVDLLCSIVGEATFDPDELARLVRETEQEIVETRNHDRALCGRAFRRTLFQGHPFARRMSGLPSSLARIGHEDVVRHAGRVFCRDNLVVAFAGDVTEKQARAATKRLRAVLPKGAPAGRVSRDAVWPRGRRMVFVDKPERTQTQMLVGCAGTHPRDEDHTAFVLGSTVFGGTFTSRLMTEVRTKRGWSYGAYSSAPIDLCRESFTVWTHPDAKDVAACLALEIELMERWHAEGITARELAFAKRYLTRSAAFEVDTASKRAQRLLVEALYDLPEGYYDGFLGRVRAVTVRDVNEAVRQRVNVGSLLIAVTGTHDRVGEEVGRAVAGLEAVDRVPFDLE